MRPVPKNIENIHNMSCVRIYIGFVTVSQCHKLHLRVMLFQAKQHRSSYSNLHGWKPRCNLHGALQRQFLQQLSLQPFVNAATHSLASRIFTCGAQHKCTTQMNEQCNMLKRLVRIRYALNRNSKNLGCLHNII